MSLTPPGVARRAGVGKSWRHEPWTIMKHPTCNSLAQQLQQISSDFIRFHQVWVFGPATCSSRSGLTCWSQSCPHRSSQLPKWHLERERPIRIPSPYLTTTSMTSALKLQKAMEISVFCIWTIYTVQYIYIILYIIYYIIYILYYIYYIIYIH